MGKRRIRNLLFHGIRSENIFGFDIRADRNKESEEKYGIRTFRTFNEAVGKINHHAYIVSTPADVHYKYFLHALKNGKHFFVEHPVTDKGYKEILNAKNKKVVMAPSCTLRFHPGVKLMKRMLKQKKIGRILAFQYHLGQYLPDWHPWEDYRNVYFSKKFTGACREMFGFELVWLTDALSLGEVKNISGITEKLSDLDMTADDRYSAFLKYDGGVSGNVVIDLLCRKPVRTLRIIGTNGVLDWEWQENVIKIFDVKTGKTKIVNLKKGRSEKGYITTEDMYEEEIGHFLKCVRTGRPFPYTFRESLTHLKTLFALEKASKPES